MCVQQLPTASPGMGSVSGQSPAAHWPHSSARFSRSFSSPPKAGSWARGASAAMLASLIHWPNSSLGGGGAAARGQRHRCSSSLASMLPDCKPGRQAGRQAGRRDGQLSMPAALGMALPSTAESQLVPSPAGGAASRVCVCYAKKDTHTGRQPVAGSATVEAESPYRSLPPLLCG
jgi:hypothetical protein